MIADPGGHEGKRIPEKLKADRRVPIGLDWNFRAPFTTESLLLLQDFVESHSAESHSACRSALRQAVDRNRYCETGVYPVGLGAMDVGALVAYGAKS